MLCPKSPELTSTLHLPRADYTIEMHNRRPSGGQGTVFLGDIDDAQNVARISTQIPMSLCLVRVSFKEGETDPSAPMTSTQGAGTPKLVPTYGKYKSHKGNILEVEKIKRLIPHCLGF